MDHFRTLFRAAWLLAGLALCAESSRFSRRSSFDGIPRVAKLYNGLVFIHMMPWFESRDFSGYWGIHWTMSNKNPDIIEGNGRRQIASHYYPDIGPYASADEVVIEYQLTLMKYAGADGIFIDWPGTTDAFDYRRNMENSEAIIRVAERVGLQYAIVYEDHNIRLAGVPDPIGQAQADMRYLGERYFPNPHYFRLDGAPLLLDFGPQTFEQPHEWEQIFSVLPQKPNFYAIGYESQEAGASADGEFCWVWDSYLSGLEHFYNVRSQEIAPKRQIGCPYPGFHSFYEEGGWGGGWFHIPTGASTWTATLDQAMAASHVSILQLNTWNDYGEGTIIEPTVEFGNQLLTILQQKLGVAYSEKELLLVRDLYHARKANVSVWSNKLDLAAKALVELRPEEARQILGGLKR